MPSLRDSLSLSASTRHFRAGLSHTAASRLESGGEGIKVSEVKLSEFRAVNQGKGNCRRRAGSR